MHESVDLLKNLEKRIGERSVPPEGSASRRGFSKK
jgi:hypothetical protein